MGREFSLPTYQGLMYHVSCNSEKYMGIIGGQGVKFVPTYKVCLIYYVSCNIKNILALLGGKEFSLYLPKFS